MNINISTASEVSKPTLSTAEVGNKDGEVAESEGFFSKLSSMLGTGEAQGKDAAQSKDAAKAEANSKTDTELSKAGVDEDVDVSQLKNKSSDELLTDEDGKPLAKAEQTEEADEGKQAIAKNRQESTQVDAESKPVSSHSSAEKIVSENERVLQQLNESNQALQPKDGKQLPLDDALVSEQARPLTSKTAEGEVLSDGKAKEGAVGGEVSQVSQGYSADKAIEASGDKSAAVPASAQRFVEPVGNRSVETSNNANANGEVVVGTPSNIQRFVESPEQLDIAAKKTSTDSNDGEIMPTGASAGIAIATKQSIEKGTDSALGEQAILESASGDTNQAKGTSNTDAAVDGAVQLTEQVSTADSAAAKESVTAAAVGATVLGSVASEVLSEDDAAAVEEAQVAEEALNPESKLAYAEAKVDSSSTAKSSENLVGESALVKTASEEPVSAASAGTLQDTKVIQAALTTEAVQAAAPLNDQTFATQTTVQSSSAEAIPWAASSESLAEEVVVQGSNANSATVPQQAAVSQSVHQALTMQQAQNQSIQAASAQNVQQFAHSPEVAQAQLQQLQQSPIAPNMVATQEQALAKAALGAKAAAGIGKMTAGSDKTTSQTAQVGGQAESNFAQQIAQAAGQSNSALNPLKAEATAAQAPLQLNREMAGEQVAERVQMMMSKNLKNIDIRLDPPELGRLQIRMNMNGDAASVQFTVANQQARDVIEQSMPRLREMLAQQGVQLGDTSVQQQAQGQQQGRYSANGEGQSGQGNSSQTGLGEENLEPDINLDLNVASKRDGISYYA